MTLALGATAPDFEADTTEGPIRFHDWIGDSWAVLFSHPKAFTPVCTTELGYMARIEPEFDPVDVRALKATAGRDLTVGGAHLAAKAIKAGLVDEFQLFVAPVIVGGGTRSLPDDVRVGLELVDERRFAKSFVYLQYRVTS